MLALISLTALLAISAYATSWEDKDWTQWTSQDCYHILTASAWAVPGPYLTDYYTKSPGHTGETIYSPTAQMASSFVIRQALVRQAQLLQHYDKMNPQQRQALDKKAATCLNRAYDDWIVVRIVGGTVPGPFRLFVDGREIHTPTPPKDYMIQCPGAQGSSIAFQRVVDGKPVIQLGAKTISIKNPSDYTFTFNVEKMVYKGKPDF